MIGFIGRRVAQALLVLFGASIMVFLLVRVLPGDPVDLLAAEEGATAEQRALLRAEMGLDQPLPLQYATFILQAIRGDLGISITQRIPVSTALVEGLGATLQLTIAGMIVAVLIALPLALISALKQNSVWDRLGTVGSMFGVSMPTFWQGIMLILLLCVAFPIFPTGGIMGSSYNVPVVTYLPIVDSIIAGSPDAVWSNLRHLVLPAITLGTSAAAMLTRLLRASLLEVKNQDFVDALRARGISDGRVIMHMLRNALPTTVIVFGSKLGTLLGGTLVIEVVFSWPGLGALLVEAISARDYPVVQGAVLVATIMVILCNLLADVAQGWLDPRVQYAK
ncbi:MULTISPECIES: ABC transporter permease [unclassified Microbacterium]|uniref:ABC transporter permease n=1 Tax=unclassified Microbacterium TaxID=2609290 RepID=UPI00214B99F3|nr:MULTISPECIES: ABC transporter permease [unclassified Microbacterium]MCR2800393.1 ABC transporter permease [Microbacterium sp. zg.Y818]MCR2826229.1 ABC transporter permease [Microbacterium sp. zg.Y909]WIM22353.1 ABC transporter permease [Microbacterium sp. zg-Y818]